jgi:AcrR family transcriptional regulator
MADIAAQAGISQGLAYRYFTGKEQLLAEVIAESQQSAHFERFLSRSGSPIERLTALVGHVLDDEGDLALSGFSGMANDGKGSQEWREWRRRRRRALHAIVRQLIIEGQRVGEIVSGHPDRLTLLLRATLDGLRALSLDDDAVGTGRVPSADMILRGIRAEIPRHAATPAVPMPPSPTGRSGERV